MEVLHEILLPLEIYLFISECTSWSVVPGVFFHGKYILFVCIQNISCEGMQNSSFINVSCVDLSTTCNLEHTYNWCVCVVGKIKF